MIELYLENSRGGRLYVADVDEVAYESEQVRPGAPLSSTGTMGWRAATITNDALFAAVEKSDLPGRIVYERCIADATKAFEREKAAIDARIDLQAVAVVDARNSLAMLRAQRDKLIMAQGAYQD